MDRRRYLLGLAGIGALSGVPGGVSDSFGGAGADGPAGTTRPTDADRSTAGSLDPGRPTFGDVSLPVDRADLVRGAPKDAIRAVDDPAFASDWRGVDGSLADDDLVVGVVRDGRARAYPLAVLTDHEVVNDDFAGPLLVTYCPLCASAVTAVRQVDGEPAVFGVSGYLFRSDLVLYDRETGSLWSQLMATAIRGRATGQRLALVPSTLATWGEWAESYPETEVLLPPPHSGTVARAPNGGDQLRGRVGVAAVGADFADDRLPKRALVLGIATDDAAVAYPRETVDGAGVVNDWVGDLPVVVAARSLPVAYDRRVGGEVLTFERVGDRLVGGGSMWSTTTGEALSGPYEGRRLDRLAGATTTYWFAWVGFHPETTVYGE